MWWNRGITEEGIDRITKFSKTITVPTIRLERGDFGTYLIVNEDSGKDILVQTDWDFPGVASTFGWPGIDEESEIIHYLDDRAQFMDDIVYKGKVGYVYFDNNDWFFVDDDKIDWSKVVPDDPEHFENYIKSLGVAEPIYVELENFDKLKKEISEISKAQEWLDDHIGETAEDPGYFDQEDEWED